MSGYTQTLLIDANRLNSEEFNGSSLAEGGDNAVFTNKVSSGITLDIGDQVSIHEGFISERGAGGSVIEFKGKPLGGLKTIEYTNSVSTSFVGFSKSQTAFSYESSSLITEEIALTDNEVSFVIEYHTNANGENYLTLPRNFANASTLKTGGGLAYPSWNASSNYWTSIDGYPLGMNTVIQNASHVYDPDWHLINHDFANASGAKVGAGGIRPRKVRNDNSKFTLFKQNEIVWNGSEVSNASNLAYVSFPANYYDPACHGYQIYKEKKTIRVDPGYDSPSNIASTITDQLIEADDPISLDKLDIGSGRGSTIVNASLYKAFPATNINRFNGSTNIEFAKSFAVITDHSPIGWAQGTGAGPAPNASALMWANAYGYVGFKRPKLIEQGRKTFAYHGNFVKTMTSASTQIKTNITWSLEVLTNIKKLFDIQHDLYPDLIKNGINPIFTNYTAVVGGNEDTFLNEARFFHLGSSYTANDPTAPLGDDMYNVSYTNPYDAGGLGDVSSKPLFIYFNNNCSDLSPEYWTGQNDDELAFGFARRNNTDNTIIFTTERIGGIQASYCDQAGVPRILKDNTKIGFDYHFNAYGNAAVMLHNGFNYAAYYGDKTGSPEGGYINGQTYVGANNPLLNFDGVQNRFEFSNLHTAEKVGNFYNAGNPLVTGNELAPPPSQQGGLDCYKINKVNHYDTFSPSMRPYPTIPTTLTATGAAIIPFSFMYQEYEIIDANCGVSIVDMGVDEKEWKNSLWGILGFSYRQFNPKGSILDINSRITNNSTNVSGATTDASIVSSDSLDYPVNIFGTNLYNTQLLTEYSDGVSNVFPPTVVLSTSTVITADDLPRKILRGYFLIESDILSDANYYLEANPLQVMAIANKYQAQTDFVNYDGANAVKFTVTKKKVLTDIVTKIKDPDGSLAQVGENSAVIYRVDKKISTDLHFAENVLKGLYNGKPQTPQ